VSVVGTILLVAGLGLATVGLYGLLRKPDIFHQLHAAGLVTGPGVLLVLLASLATGRAETISSAFLVMVCVLVTSSLSTHAIARAAWRQSRVPGPSRVSPGDSAQAEPRGAVPSRPMRVLIAHDGSTGADLASALVAGVAWPQGSTLRLVGVLEADVAPFSMAGAETTSTAPGIDAILDAATLALERAGASIERKMLRGSLAPAIADEAAAFGADLIVTGSRGRSRLNALLVGSVTGEIVDQAPCPVLVARSATLRRALLAIDGTPPSTGATDVVARWPMFREAPVTVLHVARDALSDVQPTGRSQIEETGEEPTTLIDLTTQRLLAAGVAAAGAVVRGADPATAIVEFAEQHALDLIVVGSRGHSGLRRTVVGSVARGVLFSTSASVLIVRARHDQAI
jgi:monovalent cation/proton antiporter MnhG/PhaG subunit